MYLLKKNIILILILAPLVSLPAMGKAGTEEPQMVAEAFTASGDLNEAVFAGGCFWGVEAVFEKLDGVNNVMSGYSGGKAEKAKYSLVGSGQTDHAEAVHIEYDPEVITYEQLLEVFFNVAHDPTQLNYQGPDVGPQYRSAVFYADEEQKMKTEMYIKELAKRKVYGQQIVTEVTELDAFYPAEEYHQDFMALNPNHPYIVYWDVPKIRDLEEKYPDLIGE